MNTQCLLLKKLSSYKQNFDKLTKFIKVELKLINILILIKIKNKIILFYLNKKVCQNLLKILC